MLGFADIFGFRAASALFDIENYLLAFSQAFISIHINRRKMDEDIAAGFLVDEAVTFFVVEPFYCTICQNIILLS